MSGTMSAVWVRRVSVLVAAVLAATVLVVAAPESVRTAQATVGCTAATSVSTGAELDAAIVCYSTALAGAQYVITVAADITLSTDLTAIFNDTTAALTIDGGGFTLDGANIVSIVLNQTGGDVVVSDLTITGAQIDGFLFGYFHGGGQVHIERTSFLNNNAGLCACSPDAATTVSNSTFHDNTYDGILVDGGLILSQSTIADHGNFSVYVSDYGVPATLTLVDSVLARGAVGECGGPGVITDGGGNIVQDATCTGTAVPEIAAGLAASAAANGCTAPCTPTVALLLNSPAIDAAGDCAIATDQRGEPRTAGRCDAGAFEFGDHGTCATLVATHTGTAGDDIITGTPGDDVITGLAGNDTIDGGGGNDTICGDEGDDVLSGGAGDDKLFGSQGADTIDGGAGDDTIHGNRGADILDGGAGDDRIFGYANNDVINGGPGHDRLHGNYGEDTINGGDGDDRIFGYGDDDTLNGDAGNDLIGGNRDDDTINGGAGDDVLYGSDGNDFVDGNDGNDIVAGNSLNDIVNGGAGNDALDGGIGVDTCDGGPDTDTAVRCETILSVP